MIVRGSRRHFDFLINAHTPAYTLTLTTATVGASYCVIIV